MAAKKAEPKNDIASKARAFIEKSTGQKALGAQMTTFPHISSGSVVINTLIGGSVMPDGKSFVCPGIPLTRITEIYGAESSGKTTAAIKAMVAVQKAGGVAMFLDFENALHHGYAKAMGLSFDQDQLLYYTPDTLEEGLKMIYIGIKMGVSLIVVDSVSAMVPKSELEKKLDDPAKIGALASAMSTNLPKVVQWLKNTSTALILINQIRSLIQSGHGDKDNTSGGKAVKFYASVRLKLTRIKSEIVEKIDPVTLKKKKTPYGNLVQVKVIKDKLDAKQGATGEIFIRYGSGIDDYMSLIEAAVPRKIVTKDGAGYTYGSVKVKGREQFRKHLMENPKTCAEIQAKVQAALLAAAPEPLTDDEIDDEDIIADLNRELGDDETFDTEEVAATEEEVPEGDALGHAHRGL